MGDIAFPQPPAANSASFRANGQEYAGERSVYDPLANPLFAPAAVLARTPPIQLHTAISEVLSACDNIGKLLEKEMHLAWPNDREMPIKLRDCLLDLLSQLLSWQALEAGSM